MQRSQQDPNIFQILSHVKWDSCANETWKSEAISFQICRYSSENRHKESTDVPRVKLGDEPRVSVSFIFRERGRARKFWKIIPPSGRASRIFKYSIRHRGIRGNVFECEREIRVPAPPSSGEIINDPSVNETFRRATMNASYRVSLRKVFPLTFL